MLTHRFNDTYTLFSVRLCHNSFCRTVLKWQIEQISSSFFFSNLIIHINFELYQNKVMWFDKTYLMSSSRLIAAVVKVISTYSFLRSFFLSVPSVFYFIVVPARNIRLFILLIIFFYLFSSCRSDFFFMDRKKKQFLLCLVFLVGKQKNQNKKKPESK